LSRFEASASILIGLMLMVVAFFVARDSRHLLLGAAALPEERQTIEHTIECHPGIDRVQELLTLVLGPKALLVAARVDLRNDLAGDEVERISSEIEEQLRDAVPDVTEVFLDATPSRACDRALACAAPWSSLSAPRCRRAWPARTGPAWSARRANDDRRACSTTSRAATR